MNVALFIPNIKSVCGRSAIGKSLVIGLLEKGVSVFLITNKESDINFCADLNLPILILRCDPGRKSLYSVYRSVKELWWFVKKHKIEIINTHHRYTEFISLLMRIIFRADVKIVTTVHSYTKNFKILSYRSDALIAVSRFIKDHLVKKYGRDDKRIELIFNGIEKNKRVFQDMRKSDKKIIFGLGRLEYEKGYDLLINAAACKKDILGEYSLILAGEGSEETRLADLAIKTGVSLRIIKSSRTPWDLLTAADIVVVPSRIEALGLVILEAGLAGKCVIASDAGGIPEIIENNVTGLLFESGNYQRLADSLEKAVMDNQFAKMLGSELRKKVEDKFSMDEMINKYAGLFDKFKVR